MRKKTNWVATIFLIIGSLFILFPIYMAIIVSVKSPQQLAQSVLAIPSVWHWDNFSQAVQITNYFHTFGNSFFITFIAVILTVLTNSMVAYAIARNRRNILFKSMYYYFFAAMFVPFQIIMLPLVRQMSHIGLANSVGLIVLYLVYGLSLISFYILGTCSRFRWSLRRRRG